MKTYFKILIFLILSSWSTALLAQNYNNEWIDYSKTYYKFKLAQTGLYRINAATLQSLGLNNTPGNQFQLWRNGQLVPIYISSTDETKPLASTDYIEFWGKQNDGEPDVALYKNKSSQLSKFYSLETDSASFFLTINTNVTQNQHYQKVSNTAPAGSTPEPYCWGTWEFNGNDKVNKGRSNNNYGGISSAIYSSTYDDGEGWTTNDISSGTTYTQNVSNITPYSSGPAATVSVSVTGTSDLGVNRNVAVLLNNTSIASKVVNQQDIGRFEVSVPASALYNGVPLSVTHNVSPANSSDRIVIGNMTVRYPQTFTFGGSTSFHFSMEASTSSSYIVITGYGGGSFVPYLYDITNGVRYNASVQNGSLQFYLNPNSAARRFIYIGQDNQSVAVTNISNKNFVDYKATNQGDFLIISGSILRTGSDPVEQYRAYRSSQVGGGFNAKIYDISQLEDQFSFGIRMHPHSVKNFLRYARNGFSVKPKYVFLLGHGLTYDAYYPNRGASNINNLAIIPTFGWPASDNILVSDDYNPVAATPVGRLTATTPTEVSTYLSKVKEYEGQQQSTTQTIDNKAWMKTAVHIAGGNNDNESNELISYLQSIQGIITDTLLGYTVYNFNKNTNTTSASINNALLGVLFKSGIGMINYFGHASSTKLDYNLDVPSSYANAGKYPTFYASGCDVMMASYSYENNRIGTLTTIPENFILTPNAGSINFVAQSYLGVATFMQNYNFPLFSSMNRENYNKPMSISMTVAAQEALSIPVNILSDTLTRQAQVEQITMFGDPAIKVNSFAKPDFDIEASSVIVSPSYIDVSQSKFHIKAYIRNLGKATGDSLLVQIKHQHTNGSSDIVFYKNIASVKYIDSIELDIPINAAIDQGQNTLIFNLDPLNKYDELSKLNNVLNVPVFVYSIGLNPIYPYNYSIVNKQVSKLVASTANPIAPMTQYVMEIDTTTLFNSPLKYRQTISSIGGVLEFDPGLTFQDSTVYYWRVSDVPSNGGIYHWNHASFIYLAKSKYTGYNQSHLYQHLESNLQRISLDSNSRIWNFGQNPQLFEIRMGIFGISSSVASDFSIIVNTAPTTTMYYTNNGSFIINLFDPKTLKPIYNQAVPSTTLNSGEGGFFQSYSYASGVVPSGADVNMLRTNFEFSNTAFGREQGRQLLNWVKPGTLVVIRMFPNRFALTPYLPTWQTDPVPNLYTKLIDLGFTNLSQADAPKNWSFVYENNNPSFTPFAKITTGPTDQINFTTNIYTPDSLGFITSPKFGPANTWHTLLWDGKSLDPGPGDNATIDIYGINNAGQSSYLQTVPMNQTSYDISAISAQTYPYLQLKMRNFDSTYNTPYQLKYWRLLYDGVPEGALAANVYYKSDKDTINKGANYAFAIAFKNISDLPFRDSIKVNYTLTDKNNVSHLVVLPKLKALAPGDTSLIKVAIPGLANSGELSTTVYTGMNSQYLDVNPNNDQPEFTHVNNFLGKPLLVKADDGNAALDVTFDGLHILNNDIVSAKPQIIVKLLSDSKSQLLQDTSLLTLYLKYPDGTMKRFKYGTDTLLFTQAKDTSNNFALANFAPYLTQDGTYQLIVQGKSSTDATKTSQYTVSFQVYNKPMISDMFNYPNPFTTSTAFVFTLTGSVVPQNIRIEILTITGKIVKEITKTELGPLHIGRNVTEYKWDGTDQYGQKLANGVYIYRVLTNLEGKKLDRFEIKDSNGSVNTGQYFNKGYGKMYLMR